MGPTTSGGPVPVGADLISPHQGALVASSLRRHNSMAVSCACQPSSPRIKPSTCAEPTAVQGSTWPGPCSTYMVRGQGCVWSWVHMRSPKRCSHRALSAGGNGPRVQVSPERTQVHEGSIVRLYCRVAGVPSATITWKKEGGSLPPQVRRSIWAGPTGSAESQHLPPAPPTCTFYLIFSSGSLLVTTITKMVAYSHILAGSTYQPLV